jgi:hypothetical protein
MDGKEYLVKKMDIIGHDNPWRSKLFPSRHKAFPMAGTMLFPTKSSYTTSTQFVF